MISIRNKEFQEAMRLLGQMYGVKDQNSFVQMMLAGSVDEDKATSDQLLQLEGALNSKLSQLADAVLSMNGQGVYIEELIKSFDEYVEGDSEGVNDDLAKKLKAPPSADNEAIISVLPSKDSGKESGYLRAVTMGDVIEGDVGVDVAGPKRRSMAVVEMHHPNLNYSNRDSLAASVFLQALPSIEISRAVPYFDIKVITKMLPVAAENNDGDDKSKLVFTNGISIYKFLHCDHEIPPDSTVYNQQNRKDVCYFICYLMSSLIMYKIRACFRFIQ